MWPDRVLWLGLAVEVRNSLGWTIKVDFQGAATDTGTIRIMGTGMTTAATADGVMTMVTAVGVMIMVTAAEVTTTVVVIADTSCRR